LLDERGVAGKQLHVSGDRTQIALSRQNLHDEAHLREALATRFDGRAQLMDGLGAVSVIGAGINATHANVLRGTDVLAGAGITPAGTATSSFRITWMVPRDRTDEAVRLLHRRFVESPG
jgi:aspartate kinase